MKYLSRSSPIIKIFVLLIAAATVKVSVPLVACAGLAFGIAGCANFYLGPPRSHYDLVREAKTDEELLVVMRQISGGVEPHRRVIAAPRAQLEQAPTHEVFSMCFEKYEHPHPIPYMVIRGRGSNACEVFLTLSNGDDGLSEAILDAIQARFENTPATDR